MRKTYDSWRGVDTRSLQDAADPKTLRRAINVDLGTDGMLLERDGLRLVAQVDADSVGLYSLGGSLRAAMAAGHSKPASVQGTVPITYDFVGDGTIYALNSITKVTSVSGWDVDSAVGLYPVIVVKRSSGAYEIHWIKDRPVPSVNGAPPPPYVPSNDPVSTKVAVPFSPGETIIKSQEKMFAIDNTNGVVWYCSTVNGLDDWTTEGDAGFLPVLRHATGDRTIRGLGIYDGMMAVMFTDSIQLWQTSPTPSLMQLVRILNGPGVQYPGTVANARGDLVYFSRGVFSSLRRSDVNGQLRDGDIGAPIADDTKPLASYTNPIALWSQARGAYYCFFGTTAWRFMSSPTSKRTGWTSYELPNGITADAICEHLGELYVRSGANVYRFEAGYADGSSYTVDLHFLDCDTPGEWKFVRTMDFTGYGTPIIEFFPDMRDPDTTERLCRLDGATASLANIAVLENSEAPSFRFTGLVGDGFAMDRFSIDVTTGS